MGPDSIDSWRTEEHSPNRLSVEANPEAKVKRAYSYVLDSFYIRKNNQTQNHAGFCYFFAGLLLLSANLAYGG
jgi:hypothetical protein